jgi:putative heme-binding domain-containing protein
MRLRGPFGGEFGVVSRLRAAGVALARHGMPGEGLRRQLIELLDRNLPTRSRRIDIEVVKLLAALGSETVVAKAVPMISASQPSPPPAWSELIQRNDSYGGPIQKMIADMPPLEGIDLAFALRHVERGWTIPLRRQYFAFINRAARASGGASFAGFLTNCRTDALSHCTATERAACADLTGEVLGKSPDFAIEPPKGPGRLWTVDEAVAAIETDRGGRDFERGRSLYHAVACAACHAFAGSGGGVGPDLSTVANKFSARDLLTAILEPSAAISDQYGSSIVTRRDGSTVFGRAVQQEDGGYAVYPMDPTSEPTRIAAGEVAKVADSPISQMPIGLTYALNEDELRDLIAYLMSGGDRGAPAFGRR